MDESNAIRAITIGVSILIAIATISAVLMYYNTAKATVQEIGTGTDLYGNYSTYIQDILVKPNGSKISGTDVINILNYFYDNPTVQVKLISIATFDSDLDIDNFNNNKTAYQASINKILPVQDVEIISENENGILKIVLERIL